MSPSQKAHTVSRKPIALSGERFGTLTGMLIMRADVPQSGDQLYRRQHWIDRCIASLGTGDRNETLSFKP